MCGEGVGFGPEGGAQEQRFSHDGAAASELLDPSFGLGQVDLLWESRVFLVGEGIGG